MSPSKLSLTMKGRSCNSGLWTGSLKKKSLMQIGCKPFLIALIEQRAVERLTEAFRDLGADGEIVRFWVA
jgi:hypothetical protein